MPKTPVFVHIPKTAGNSVRSALSGAIDVIDIGHSTVRRQKLIGPQYFSFCFVRDPLSRLRSAFFHLTDLRSTIGDETDAFHVKRRQLNATYGDDFGLFVADAGFEKYNLAHFLPQTHWTHHKGKQILNFIGRLEDIEHEWERLGRELGISMPSLARRNITTNNHYNEPSTLSSKQFQRIYDHYIRDYTYLRYDKPY